MATRRRSNVARRRRAPARLRRTKMYRKRRSRKARTLNVPNSVPGRAIVGLTMRTVAYSSIAPATIAASNFQTSIRPLLSGVGATLADEPQGFDQWKLFYAQYRILSMNVTISHTNSLTAGAVTPLQIESYTQKDLSALTEIGVIDNKYTKVGSMGSQTNRIVHKFKIKPWVIMGLTRQQYMDDPATAASTGTTVSPPTNPASMVYLIHNVRNKGAVAQNICRTISFKLKIELTEPIIVFNT